MKPQIVSKEAFHVIGMKITCAEEQLYQEMPKLWEKFLERVHEIPQRKSEFVVDICLQHIDNDYTQLVCVEVDNLSVIPEDMVGLSIPKQTYAFVKHTGSEEDIWKSFYILQDWIEEKECLVDPKDFKMDYKSEKGYHNLYQKIML